MTKKKSEVKIIKDPKFKEDETFISHNDIKIKKKGQGNQQQQEQLPFVGDPTDLFRQQILLINDFVDTIRAKQLEELFKLSETQEITLGKETYKRKKLTAFGNRELVQLDTRVSTETDNVKRIDLLIKLREKEGEHYFGIPKKVVNDHYEELEDVLDACLLKTYTGISSSKVNIAQLLEQFKKRYDNSVIMKQW